MAKENENPALIQFFLKLGRLFYLRAGTDEAGTVEAIKFNTDFKSENAWTLIFAIFIASIGLNVNSTAVIIGAMLISPLMGPILGAGLALGTNDFELLKRAIRNLGFAVAISVITSTVFFLISPISSVQSELLARTRPTVYDVLIAIFGGMAGIIAVSRKEKGNAVPGVAIATALMPPLCTAGFGLANGYFTYFVGALYLFTINSVFICFSTFLFIRYLRFEKQKHLDPSREKRVRQIMLAIGLIVFIPSVIVGWIFLKEESYHNKAQKFIKAELRFPNSYLVQQEIKFSLKKQEIVVDLIGDRVSENKIEGIKARLDNYGLSGTVLEIRQSSLADQLEKRLSEKVRAQNADFEESQVRLSSIQNQLGHFTETLELTDQLRKELPPLFSNIEDVAVVQIKDRGIKNDFKLGDSEIPPLRKVAVIHWNKPPSRVQRSKLHDFLKVRLKDEQLEMWNVIR